MSAGEDGDVAADHDEIIAATIESVLESFDEALTLVATAASAIENALDSTLVEDVAEPSEKIEVLVRGVKELRRARIEIAVALHGEGLR